MNSKGIMIHSQMCCGPKAESKKKRTERRRKYWIGMKIERENERGERESTREIKLVAKYKGILK